MRHEVHELGFTPGIIERHRRGKIAQQRRHGRSRDILEDEALFGVDQVQQPGCHPAPQIDIFAVRPDQPDGHRNQEIFLLRQPCRRRTGLGERQRIAAGGSVVTATRRQFWRSGLAIPGHETRKVKTGSCRHRRDKILAGHRLPVVTLEVDFHAPAEGLTADQRLDHAHHLGALFIDRSRVEIVDLDIAGRTHRMRHRPGIFGELGSAQTTYFADAGRGTAVRVGAEFLIAEHRQPFLERELEPVAAGHAVAGPVVKIFVGNHPVDILEIQIGRHILAGQHVLGVEDVEPLVLHRPHVEITHGDDHVVIEITFETETLLIPVHRLFQRRHRVRALVELAWLDINRQLHRAPGQRAIRIAQHVELPGNHGKQVGRLAERIFPGGEMAALGLVTGSDRIAVGQQHREARFIRVQRHRVARHHVGTVDKPGDVTETLWLALREIAVLRTIKAGKAGVCVGLDTHLRLQAETFRHRVDAQLAALDTVIHGLTIKADRQCFQFLTVKP